MEYEWLLLVLGDTAWVVLAFALGFLVSQIGLPPMLGYLAAGFALQALSVENSDVLQRLADLGITLLLFTVGLKLNVRMLLMPQVWAVALLHMAVIVVVFGLMVFAVAGFGISYFLGVDLATSFLIAFALSFSSTVFAVKSLQEKGDMNSRHGRIAIGILVMQDLVAVIFLALSTGKLPSVWALGLVALWPLRHVICKILEKAGHGELLILYGLVLAIGSSTLFDAVGVKADLGPLIMGLVVASHPKAKEMATAMLSLKDLFLVGFFITIGLSGQLTTDAVIIALALLPFIFIKAALFYRLLMLFKLRARVGLLTSLNLNNYSEFGLIVAALAVSNNWLDAQWLVTMALALSFSFIVASPLIIKDNVLYAKFRQFLQRYQMQQKLPEDGPLNTRGATIAVFGMGRVGCRAYDYMRENFGEAVVGIDVDGDLVERHRQAGRHALFGDPSDPDFWEKLDGSTEFDLVMLALPTMQANIDALNQLRSISQNTKLAAIARYPDEEQALKDAGADDVYDIYTEAGTGYAEHVIHEWQMITR